ncbi:hypothetical protein BDR07DRAFT_1411271 [Suillus spraguei]|nr:hypothetical protein BDR07DRAFT_1446062 [Suillus spraguei]KAG2360949.1 hypothetical protein BDR07DRAFT_1411271 [Suillus spraguei]
MWQSGIFSMGYLSLPALKNLKKSLVSRYLLTPYWNWFIKLFPLTITPNTITLLGLCIVAFNVITLLYYDPLYLTEKDGAVGPPQWIYFTCAHSICSKQARRTGMAGPLGEMLNHGCDALNTTLEVVLAVHRTRFDQYPLL